MEQNLNILNKTKIIGGVYQDIRIFDSFLVEQDIKANQIDIYYESIFQSLVQSKNLNINSLGTFFGPVKAINCTIKGSGYFYHELKCDVIKVSNELKMHQGKIVANEVQFNGIASISSMDASNLSINGMIECSEVIRSQNIEIKENAFGFIQEIIGSTVKIYSSLNKRLEIHQLYAYNVCLKNVTIDILKAKNIDIKENVMIHHIEYL